MNGTNHVENEQSNGVLNFGLNQLATSFKGMVDKVRLNHHAFNTDNGQPIEGVIIEAADFELEQVYPGSTIYELEFNVPTGVHQIVRLELLDRANNVLTRHMLFVPIETNARFRYVLTFNNMMSRRGD